MFQAVLKEVVEGTEGGLATLLMDFEGIAVDSYSKPGSAFDIATIGGIGSPNGVRKSSEICLVLPVVTIRPSATHICPPRAKALTAQLSSSKRRAPPRLAAAAPAHPPLAPAAGTVLPGWQVWHAGDHARRGSDHPRRAPERM